MSADGGHSNGSGTVEQRFSELHDLVRHAGARAEQVQGEVIAEAVKLRDLSKEVADGRDRQNHSAQVTAARFEQVGHSFNSVLGGLNTVVSNLVQQVAKLEIAVQALTRKKSAKKSAKRRSKR